MQNQKWIAFLLVALVLMTLVPTSFAASEPLFSEPKTFTFFIGNYWQTTLMDENFQDTVSLALKEATNVTLDIDMVRSKENDSEINLLIASGDLPDMIFKSGIVRTQMITDGLVIPLDDLVKSHGPNIQKNFDFVLDDWREPDGNLYGIGCFVWNDPKYALNFSVNTIHMRYDILKEMGYEKLDRTVPMNSFITMDEYLALLDQVRAKYPDMQPTLMNAYNAVDVMLMSKGHQYTNINGNAKASFEDGKAVSWYSSKYLPEIITFLNNFFHKGYVPDDMATMTLEQNQSLIASGKVFSTFGNIEGLDTAQAALSETNDDSRMVMFYLTEDKAITDLFVNNYAVSEPPNMLISSQCEYPEDVMKYLDFCASYEGSTIICAGVEGVTYTKDEKGFMTPVDEVLNGYASWDVNMIKKFGIGSWLNTLPCLEGMGPNGQAFDINAEKAFTSDRWVMYNNTDYQHIAYPRLLSAVGRIDQEEQWEAYDALSKISAYAGDRIEKAVLSENADAAMSEWNKCVEQMKADGLDKLDLAVEQAWNKLSEHYKRDPAKLIATEATR